MTTEDDDSALFRASIQGTQPLVKNNTLHHSKVVPKARRRPQETESNRLPINQDVGVQPVNSDCQLSYFQAGLQPKTWHQLRQGKLAIDAELDLHGYTVDEAEHQLDSFFQQALAHHCRVIHIIHGKGLTSLNAEPPVKNLVNRFLSRCPVVLAFCSAPKHQGGAGAVNVLLKSPEREV